MADRLDGELEPVGAAEKYRLLPYAQRLTSSATITPTTGKRPQLVWAQVIADPDNASSNLVTISMTIGGAATDIYKVYALGRTAVFTGDVNTTITITLANSWPITVNIQYREVDA